MDTAQLASELARPEAYAGGVRSVRFLQTHISLLFLTEDRVYKVKKAVDLGFLDYSTLERRRFFCEQEVRLNRRLAPRVYLGVVPITRASDGHLRMNGPGEPLEWAVEMVRLPEARMLEHLLERGAIDNQMMNDLADLLVAFHAAAPTGHDVDPFGSAEAVRANVEQNFEALAPFVAGTASDDPRAGASCRLLSGTQEAFLRERARSFLEAEAELFARRLAEGRIREGHGDLHASNVCYTDEGVLAYDCIEFSRRFRCGDVAADLAFLAMDLDQRGYPAFSRFLVRRYAEAAGDGELPRLIGFYKAYRAVVRGKVAALTTREPGLAPEERRRLEREGRRYLQLAASYELPPALVLMCGLPASGKSWLARQLARPLRAVVLQSDVRRKVLAGMAPRTRVRAEHGAGLYARDQRQRTYRSLLGDALETLRAGHSVVVDASFARRDFRSPFVDAVARLELPYYVVHVRADDALVRERLAQRADDPGALSDAGLAVYEGERALFEPPDEVPEGHVVAVQSGREDPEEQSSLLIDRMIGLRRR